MNNEQLLHIVVDSIPITVPSWIEVLSAFLTPIIAVVTAYIAYQQYHTNQQQLRHETYERRIAVYKAIQKYLSEIIRDGKTSYERIFEFTSEVSEAVFLFDNSVQEKIDEIYKKSIRMVDLKQKLYPLDGSSGLPKGEERNKVVNEEKELLTWHTEQFSEIRSFFVKKMGLKLI